MLCAEDSSQRPFVHSLSAFATHGCIYRDGVGVATQVGFVFFSFFVLISPAQPSIAFDGQRCILMIP